MTNAVLYVCLQVFTNCVSQAGALTLQAPDNAYRAFALRPVYDLTYTNRCGYCTAVDERNRNGWLVHIEGTCTCKPCKRFSHYELVPQDGKETTP